MTVAIASRIGKQLSTPSDQSVRNKMKHQKCF